MRKLKRSRAEVPAEGNEGIATVGHRAYVGGMWDEIGALQFNFMVSQGLRPGHVLLDIACGSLRGGVHFIPYLDAGNYLGVEKEQRLIDLGISQELDRSVVASKTPELVVSDSFDFKRFSKRPDYALAQSLFTHLPSGDILGCLSKLRDFSPGCRLFATFFLPEGRSKNPKSRHDHLTFRYGIQDLADLAAASGWEFRYVGDWGHPRGQVMAEFC
jgi:hypothetical protein